MKVHKPQFWDLFVHPVYKGIKLQVLAWVAYHSWGQVDWDNKAEGKPPNRKFTVEPIRPAIIARDIGAHRKGVSAAILALREDGVLIQNEDGCEGIDKKRLENSSKWTKTASLKTRRKMGTVPKNRDARPEKSGQKEEGVPNNRDVDSRNNQPGNQLQTLQTLSDLQTKRFPAASRRENYEFNAVNEAIQQKFGLEENPKRIGLALKECRAADLHPLDLIDHAAYNWFGYVQKACHSPDDYRDRMRSYVTFEEEVVPLDPAVKALVQAVM